MHDRLGSIERLASLWHDETRPATRWACIAAAAAGLVAAALLGRVGAPTTRAAAAAALLLGLLPTVLRVLATRRRARDPRAIVDATLLRTEPELGRAALRAMTLAERTGADPDRGSHDLARLHFARLLGRASLPRLRERAARVAWAVVAASLAVAAAVFAAVVLDPFKVVEGADVLAARDGVAPVAVPWLEGTRVSAEPPPYLDRERHPVRPYFPASLHVGTHLTVRGVPIHPGRALVLTDGSREVPFTDDGDGAVVARFTVETDATLTIAARFGEVIVPEPKSLEVHAVVDHAPFVRLAGSPSQKRLLEHPRVAIHWEAFDDHGIREVALVLRAGEREVRRALSSPQGSAVVDRGGIELRADDKFLEQSYLPVEVTVEALDNDPVSGPKWGKSDTMILLPPQIGEREAMRYRALEAARDRLTDLLAARLTVAVGADRRAYLAAEAAAQKEIDDAFRAALDGDYGGLRLRGRLAALVRGQLEQLRGALAAASTLPSPKDRAKLVEVTENALLAIDSGLGALGTRDTRQAALALAEVAMESAAAITRGASPVERDRADRLLYANLAVLEAGGGFMVELGVLGRDLGELVENGVRRIRRPLAASDRHHARLAAEDLAARLRRPDPSFGSAGSGHGGVESGGMAQPGEGEPSEAAEQMAGLERALEELRQEHAQQMQEVDQALRDALPTEEREALQEKLRETARQVREAVDELPQQAADPASARAQAARARSQAESMADALERGDLGQAIEQGEQALDSLEKAEQTGQASPSGSSEREMGERASQAQGELSELMQEGQATLEQMRERASQGARGELEKAGQREGELAERARQLAEQSAAGEAPLPEAMLDRLDDAAEAMQQAAGELGKGEGARGREKQREAQRLLEMSQPESESEGQKGTSEGDGKDFARDADVPPEARDQRALDFRKRVTDGLGKPTPPHLREAIRRYTEGLLR